MSIPLELTSRELGSPDLNRSSPTGSSQVLGHDDDLLEYIGFNHSASPFWCASSDVTVHQKVSIYARIDAAPIDYRAFNASSSMSRSSKSLRIKPPSGESSAFFVRSMCTKYLSSNAQRGKANSSTSLLCFKIKLERMASFEPDGMTVRPSKAFSKESRSSSSIRSLPRRESID